MQALRARASSKYITNYIHHLSTTMQRFYVIKIKYPFFLNPIQPVKISNIMASRSNIFRAGDLLFLDNDTFFFTCDKPVKILHHKQGHDFSLGILLQCLFFVGSRLVLQLLFMWRAIANVSSFS